jgi:hypothetical protein
MTARFKNVSCSQCGNCFGPGDEGYSHCSDHVKDAAEDLLEALQNLVGSLVDVDEEGLIEHADEIVAARAAVAKALGADE